MANGFDIGSMMGGGGGGSTSKEFGRSSAATTFDLGSGDTSQGGINSTYILIGLLGLGLLALLIWALKK